ncbi:thymocyte nuclear protein 1, transcript variant X9 [Ictidomys tridecemlineatus]|uniref:thymocyte nuclear protein 1 isoform X2 n=1 Tax=Ictidomys tridecemlineatus TaxID=43179 RepID=UPI0006812B99|nr:thymocyte nuclear protein 1 isoform X2 [Ictidomys tridecemlineatus]KAG3286997.1 thymocyte nuclear protein 1, transcript variant X9 [Ictidomys tridecemlineatus]
MPRPRKRPTGAAGPEKKGQSEKRTKFENSGEASAKVENSSPQNTSVFKNCGKKLSNYWLMKSEPESRLDKGIDVKFSIEDLKAQPMQTACWDGVRNYQARNFLRAMKLEEEAFFYHSNCKEPGIVGLMKIVKEAYPDHTQFEKNSPHYDPSSKEDNPKWSMVFLTGEGQMTPGTSTGFCPRTFLLAREDAERRCLVPAVKGQREGGMWKPQSTTSKTPKEGIQGPGGSTSPAA